MRLAAIYNVWADWDILEHSVRNILHFVDGVIIVASEKSNYGEKFEIPFPWSDEVSLYQWLGEEVQLYKYEPSLVHPMHAETRKRNEGLDIARREGFTHFIMMDADEFYDANFFLYEQDRFYKNPELSGLVCRTQVFVKSPTLTIGLDTTLVPFIQKITPGLKHEFNKKYPFAWEGNNLRIDPTRSTNATSGIEMSDIIMHHYSWVRSDYARKIRNSTAKANLERMDLVNKLVHLKEGDIFDLYPGKPLVRVPNRFAIPEYGELAQDNNL